MAFEPINTDEKLDKAVKVDNSRDMDSQMLAGCSAFVGASVIGYGLAVWPHFLFSATHLLSALAFACTTGFVPSIIFTLFVSRRFGVPAAAGALGGSFATAIFLFLRLDQVSMTRGINDLPQPEFPASWVWIIPVGWIVATIGAVALSVRAEDLSAKPSA